MNIPEPIRRMRGFNKLRSLKHKATDYKNILNHKLHSKYNQRREPKRKLTKEQQKQLHDEIVDDVRLKKVPIFNNQPLISLIIINRNGEDHLKRLFNSFSSFNDYYSNYEVILVDNASTDNSLDIIESFTDIPIKIIQNKNNESFSHSNNQAVEIAKGDYLLFLNNDVEFLDGCLNFLMETMSSHDNVGAVGARLFYPDCSDSKINKHKSYSIQHAGIIFKESEGFVRPFNRHNGKEYYESNLNTVHEMIAVTAAVLLVKKDVFNEVHGFDERYVYGYEDVDFCLKLYKAGYHNYYDSRATLFHYEFGTQETDNNKDVMNRRLNNREVFINKWNSWLKSALLDDKINCRNVFTDNNFTVGFLVTESSENTTAGDYFTALSLATKLEKFGWNIRYYAQKPTGDQGNWYYIDDDVDVVISMLHGYDLNLLKSNNGMLIKIAWLRNWFERWTDSDFFRNYDIVLASSQKACDYIENKMSMKAILFPIATDTQMFNENYESVEDYECDYCFTGSYWNSKREIVGCLNPDALDYDFNLYGVNWEKINSLRKYIKGFVDYHDLPKVYASCKIVLDDANHVTKEFGSVNSRIFDSIASGRLILTNGTIGNQELFDGKIPEYHSKSELTSLLDYYLKHPDKRAQKVHELQEIVLNDHTYDIRANKLREVICDYIDKPKIMIKIPVPKWNEIHQWGDYYIANGLKREFIKKGYVVKLQILPDWHKNYDSLFDMVFVLRGLSEYKPKQQHFNIMWNISHPDLVSLNEYKKYNHVFISSKYWANYVNNLVDVPVTCMWQCTDTGRFYPEFRSKYQHQLLFVGNSRRVYRKIIKDLLPTSYDLAIYGSNWGEFVDKKYIKGDFIPNNKLRQAYSSCDILLNDHWDDMREKGFISNRIFDGIACGATIISDDIEGLDELFGDHVKTYKTPQELKIIVKDLLNNPKDNDISLIEHHTYKNRVEQILEIWN